MHSVHKGIRGGEGFGSRSDGLTPAPVVWHDGDKSHQGRGHDREAQEGLIDPAEHGKGGAHKFLAHDNAFLTSIIFQGVTTSGLAATAPIRLLLSGRLARRAMPHLGQVRVRGSTMVRVVPLWLNSIDFSKTYACGYLDFVQTGE